MTNARPKIVYEQVTLLLGILKIIKFTKYTQQ